MPGLAQEAAQLLPPDASRKLGQGALEIMEETLLEPSRLPTLQRQRLEMLFQRVTLGLSDHPMEFRLLIRHGKSLGANAFALPDGTVIITDGLVDLAEQDEELMGVMAHEIGHVVHRHALRHAIQDSMFTMLVFWITGDFSSATSLAATVPAISPQCWNGWSPTMAQRCQPT